MTNKAMVAVCDILGFSNLIKTRPIEEITTFHIKNYHNLLRSSIPVFTRQPVSPTGDQILRRGLVGSAFFSDSVLIYSLSDDLNGYKNVIDAVCRLIAIPILFPELRFRVGISYGDFYHDRKKKIYVGKALVEAHELEIRQDWCGGSLTRTAEQKIDSYYWLTPYDTPVRSKKRETHLTINWTLAKHSLISRKYGWLTRPYALPMTRDQRRTEHKLRNTERFHFEKCVQCRAYRKSLGKKRTRTGISHKKV